MITHNLELYIAITYNHKPSPPVARPAPRPGAHSAQKPWREKQATDSKAQQRRATAHISAQHKAEQYLNHLSSDPLALLVAPFEERLVHSSVPQFSSVVSYVEHLGGKPCPDTHIHEVMDGQSFPCLRTDGRRGTALELCTRARSDGVMVRKNKSTPY